LIKKGDGVEFPEFVEESGIGFEGLYSAYKFVDEAATQPDAKSFVIEKTKGHFCECEARNPSGKCCLKDFPKYKS